MMIFPTDFQKLTKTIRKTDFNTINEFKGKLSSELRQNVFENDDNYVNSVFNSFLNTYLQIFYSHFPKISQQENIKQLITKGIINSSKRKKELHLLTGDRGGTMVKVLCH